METRQRMASRLAGLARPAKQGATLLMAGMVAACSGLGGSASAPPVEAGREGFVSGFLGGVAAEEPRAALAARERLSAGGNAADAAVAAGFMLTVTQPARAGLGGGGACLLFDPRRNTTEALIFPPGGRAGVPQGADRPAAVPMMARGLFALHARAGRRPFEEAIVPAEQAARLGSEVSRAFATDLAAVSGPLLADPNLAAIFAPGGRLVTVGDRVVQPELGATLGTLRTAGVGDLHQGAMARRLEAASVAAGGSLTIAELRAAVPQVVAPLQVQIGADLGSFLPLPIDGGLAAAASFQALAAGANPQAAMARGVAVSRLWRASGGEAAALLAGPAPADEAWPLLPASTSLVVIDNAGQAVACAFTMNNLFGTGRMAPGTGILLAAAPNIGQVQPPLLAAGIVHNANIRAFRAAAAGSGQHGAAVAVATALRGALGGSDAAAALATVPDPGRAQLVTCSRYLPGLEVGCTAATDPRGAGLALGAADR